ERGRPQAKVQLFGLPINALLGRQDHLAVIRAAARDVETFLDLIRRTRFVVIAMAIHELRLCAIDDSLSRVTTPDIQSHFALVQTLYGALDVGHLGRLRRLFLGYQLERKNQPQNRHETQPAEARKSHSHTLLRSRALCPGRGSSIYQRLLAPVSKSCTG